MLRYALLAKGPDAINKASGSKKKRSSTGMIYMDTDRGPKTDHPLEWGGMHAPAGFLIPGNKGREGSDVLATSYAMHPVFLLAFKKCVAYLSNFEIQNKLIIKSGTSSFISSVLKHTGSILLEGAIESFITIPEIEVCYPDNLTFKSEVAGPQFNDMTWFTSSTRRMPNLSATWQIQTTSKKSGCSIS